MISYHASKSKEKPACYNEMVFTIETGHESFPGITMIFSVRGLAFGPAKEALPLSKVTKVDKITQVNFAFQTA